MGATLFWFVWDILLEIGLPFMANEGESLFRFGSLSRAGYGSPLICAAIFVESLAFFWGWARLGSVRRALFSVVDSRFGGLYDRGWYISFSFSVQIRSLILRHFLRMCSRLAPHGG